MIYKKLNSGILSERLSAVREYGTKAGSRNNATEEVNNHVHSIYSFSPYAPTMIAVKAAEAGLRAVGIMDHDSVSGAEEFLEACEAVNIASTVGFEMRVNMTGTAVEGRKTNNPDSVNNSYIAIHGIPAGRLPEVRAFLEPICRARYQRDRLEVEALNRILSETGAPLLDFDADVWAISQAADGGSITERHILYALSRKLTERYGRGEPLLKFISEQMRIAVPEKLLPLLRDPDNPHYDYDLLGIFKSTLIERIFIQPDDEECISVYDAVAFANELNAIPAYAYLGDIAESPTGDKKAEKFEDDYLDELIPELKRIGFRAVTYMPPRNTLQQLRRLQQLCDANELMQISGVDINSSRQSFNCPIIQTREFRHLVTATWALIAHEKLTECNAALSLFSPDNPLAELPLEERIRRYAELGQKLDHRRPAVSAAGLEAELLQADTT
jgi:hypothetical protein